MSPNVIVCEPDDNGTYKPKEVRHERTPDPFRLYPFQQRMLDAYVVDMNAFGNAVWTYNEDWVRYPGKQEEPPPAVPSPHNLQIRYYQDLVVMETIEKLQEKSIGDLYETDNNSRRSPVQIDDQPSAVSTQSDSGGSSPWRSKRRRNRARRVNKGRSEEQPGGGSGQGSELSVVQ